MHGTDVVRNGKRNAFRGALTNIANGFDYSFFYTVNSSIRGYMGFVGVFYSLFVLISFVHTLCVFSSP